MISTVGHKPERPPSVTSIGHSTHKNIQNEAPADAAEVSKPDVVEKKWPSQSLIGCLSLPHLMDQPFVSKNMGFSNFANLPQEVAGSVLSCVDDDSDARNLRLVDHNTKNLAENYNAKSRQILIRAAVVMCVRDPDRAALRLQCEDLVELLAKERRLDLNDLPLSDPRTRVPIVKLASLMARARILVYGNQFQESDPKTSMQTIQKVLLSMPELETIDMSRPWRVDMASRDAEMAATYMDLLQSLKRVKNLKDLALGFGPYRDEAMLMLSRVLEQKTGLSRFALSNPMLTNEFSHALAQVLRNLNGLEELSFYSASIAREAHESFSSALRATKNLKKFYFRGRLGHERSAPIIEALVNNKNLQSLSLFVSFGVVEVGVQEQAIISSWKSLEEMHLGVSIVMAPRSLKCLIGLACAAPGLTRLTIGHGGNVMHSKVVSLPFEDLRGCQALKKLCIAIYSLSESQAEEALQAAVRLPSLEILDLSYVRAVPKSIDIHTKLSLFVRSSTSLKKLMLPEYGDHRQVAPSLRDDLRRAAEKNHVELIFRNSP